MKFKIERLEKRIAPSCFGFKGNSHKSHKSHNSHKSHKSNKSHHSGHGHR